MTISLQNRIAIITGGALGIGLAISKSFADNQTSKEEPLRETPLIQA